MPRWATLYKTLKLKYGILAKTDLNQTRQTRCTARTFVWKWNSFEISTARDIQILVAHWQLVLKTYASVPTSIFLKITTTCLAMQSQDVKVWDLEGIFVGAGCWRISLHRCSVSKDFEVRLIRQCDECLPDRDGTKLKSLWHLVWKTWPPPRLGRPSECP